MTTSTPRATTRPANPPLIACSLCGGLIGWDGVLIGDDWVENEFAGGGDLWGHHGLDAQALLPKSSRQRRIAT